jgi:hypothetical protein
MDPGRGWTPPARARRRSSTAWRARIGRWWPRSRPTRPPRPGSRPTRAGCGARWRRVAPSEEPGDLPRALTFASAILRGRPRPTVVLVSDGAFSGRGAPESPADVDVRFAAIGACGGHAGLRTAGRGGRQRRHHLVRRRGALPADPSAVEAALRGQKLRPRDRASLAVDISAGDTTVERVRLELAPRRAAPPPAPQRVRADTRLRARSLRRRAADDELALDDARTRWCPLPHRRVLRVGGADLYLDGALLSLGRTSPSSACRGRRGAARALGRLRPGGVRRRRARGAARSRGAFLYLDAHGPAARSPTAAACATR